MVAKTTRELIVDQLLEIARRIEANESIEEFRAEIELGDGEGVVEFIDFSSVMILKRIVNYDGKKSVLIVSLI
jgi:hypothetical protein